MIRLLGIDKLRPFNFFIFFVIFCGGGVGGQGVRVRSDTITETSYDAGVSYDGLDQGLGLGLGYILYWYMYSIYICIL